MIELPPLIAERGFSIGRIRHQLRSGLKVEVIERTEVRISPRVSQPLLRLANGEQIILTSRKGVVRPQDIDGVLEELPNGELRWAAHRLLEDFLGEANRDGLNVVATRLANSWSGRLSFRAETRQADGSVLEGEEGLRPPQLGALHAIGAHWSLETQPATVVMPTGTGKTETMLATLAAYRRSPLLVVVPWDLLRRQTADKFLNFGLLRKLKVLPEDIKNPIVGVITKRPKELRDLDICNSCNVVVVTASALGIGVDSELLGEMASRFGSMILDEAHHVAATNWSRIKEAFRAIPILQFTATPFRRDGKLVDGKVILNYPLGLAQKDGYFKRIRFEPVHEVGGTQRADRAIATLAVQQLRHDIGQGLDHLLMARCDNITRAATVAQIYQEIAPDLPCVLIHSKEEDSAARVATLRAGAAKIAICVDMLGEGFDLPQLKIAAVHDIHRSLTILLQFAGRFTRVAGANIGDATVVANIADPTVAGALERLYSEDADWNLILSELSSEAAQEHAELVAFLRNSNRLGDSDEEATISHHLLRPVFSTAVYRAQEFNANTFHGGLEKGRQVKAAWLHRQSNTLYFVTSLEPKVRWTSSKEVRDREWALFVLHFDAESNLLFLSSTDHSSLFPELAKAVSGEVALVSGDKMFRALGRINRLIFQNIGMKKHGRRNLSFAMYTGADVATALGLAERAGSVKNNVSGTGWENGERVAIGCSYKGRVWSREQGSVPSLVKWCKRMGAKLLDENIDVESIIANVLIPEEVETFPDKIVLSLEWPAELLGIAEDRVTFEREGGLQDWPLYLVELEDKGRAGDSISFALASEDEPELAAFVLELGVENGFAVRQISGDPLLLRRGNRTELAAQYFSAYPPLVRFVDLCELDGNLLIAPKDPRHLSLEAVRFEPWDWQGVNIETESYWKDGASREDSIQWRAASHFIDGGFDIVFDDDASGEAADLVCLKEEDATIRLVLVHCKFSGDRNVGERVNDMVEVCSQAVRSAKWKWRFRDLAQHLLGREDRLATELRPSRFLEGGRTELNRIVRSSRFKEVTAEILIVQPGVSATARTPDQNMVLAAAASYLKETIGCDLEVVCSA